MGKKKTSDTVRKTKGTRDIKTNPFELKINKQKFQILGRKTKHDRGLPGVSRSKSIKKRTETLLKEYREKDKANTFIDKRFGEYDTKLTPEEKMMKRFSLERQRLHTKKNVYNLNEDEELTHYGQSLADIEKLNDMPDSDSDTEGKLSAEFTAAAHFGGGGLLRKKTSSEQEEEEHKPKSRKELIEDLIAKSKKEKHERQTQREEALVLTQKLDKEWKEVHSLLACKTPNAGPKKAEPQQPKVDDYDILVRELGFEMKAQASDRLKSTEELAKEESERLEKLEAERLRRMRGEFENRGKKRPKHMSADDLHDGFILDKDDKLHLTYKDEEEEEEEGGEEGGEEEESNNAMDSENEEEDEDEDSGDEEEEEDSHSDLESDNEKEEDDGDDDDGDDDNEGDSNDKKRPAKPISTKEKVQVEEEKQAMITAAKSELPFTFPVPESLSQLKSLLTGKETENQCLIVERIQKCNHPSLAEGNKLKLEKLFGFLWEYVGELATRRPPDLKTIDKMVPQLYELSQMFPEVACGCVQSSLQQSMQELDSQLEANGRAPFPGLDKLIYLKIASSLFPTSDFRHSVVTPAMVYMSHMVIRCSVTSLRDIAAGLFTCCVFLEYVSLSKRFIPEVVNFLLGILHMAVPNKGEILGYTLVPPFKPGGKLSDLLVVKDKKAAESWERKPLPISMIQGVELKDEPQVTHFRLSFVAQCLDLCKRCASLYKSLSTFHQIIHPVKTLLTKYLCVNDYPTQLQDLYHEVLKEIESQPKSYQPLEFERKKLVPLKLFTPKIVEVTDYGRKQGGSKLERERMKLIHKHKREFKGAVREIRKDSQFLARHQLSDIMERDAERKRKVKSLFQNLATQEGEWKAMKRQKRKT
uniref:NOP14 nucleolar protein n=1 Tax=Callorhinchus milii TaxID=7868 RepID=A0A4W3JMB5_CALMI|eukprot:gi/632974040/ref/XP_007903452.1/ PREDICTED: nucleolar protein 14 [Callorhinchus milii]